jgi:transcriptional regulator with XRE-family HTH domain
MYTPGLRLRQVREKLGLTYRDVEKASYELALKRGRPDFILHLSRLADIENRGVIPSLHKLYSMAAIYHLDPIEMASWYEAPLQQTLQDGLFFPAPKTSLSDTPLPPPPPDAPIKSQELGATGLLREVPQTLEIFLPAEPRDKGKYRCGNIGLTDRRMTPILRPGSTVLIDTHSRRVQESEWQNEYERPLYFVELREGFRCGWFVKHKSRLIMQPHPLSRCLPEVWQTPHEAEIVGRVIGVVSYLSQP